MDTAHTEDMKRHRLARMRFKGLVHLVIANRFWLQDIEEQIGLNYQRNVAIITRRTRKKGILSLQEKKIIKINHEERTLEDKIKLASVLANLKCLERFSPKARARLTPYIQYLYYGPERTIHREGSFAMAMYCILDGEVTLTKKKWDYMEKKYVESVISILGSGDTFGEVSLLDNASMPVTVKTASDVELLVLEGDYFYDTIGAEMRIEYNQKRMALSSIEYAKNWDSTQIFLACKLATINQYPALETIYAEDQGLLNPVYFVISGQCTILQCLKVKVKIINGHKRYRLFEEETESYIEKQQRRATSVYELFQHEKDKKMKEQQEKQLSDLQKEKEIDAIEEEAFKKRKAEADREEDHRKLLQVQKEMNIERLKKPGEKEATIINYCGVQIDLTPMDVGGTDAIIESEHSLPLQKETSILRTVEEYKAEYEKAVEDLGDDIEKVEDEKRESSLKEEEEEEKGDDSSISSSSSKQESTVQQSALNEDATSPDEDIVAQQMSTVLQYAVPSKINVGNKPEILSPKDFPEIRGTVHFKYSPEKKEFKKESFDYVESHFVDVGTIAAGSIFGVGENMQHRAIMAKTTVQCMQIPRYWLFEKKQNPGNIWQRLQFHLNATIPSRETLFKDFLATRRWDEHKKKVVDSVVQDKKAHNATKIDDIPIICRILEGMYD